LVQKSPFTVAILSSWFFRNHADFIEPTAHHGKHMIELRFAARQKVFLRLSLILRLAQLFASGLV
jgi:hypothetical protein